MNRLLLDKGPGRLPACLKFSEPSALKERFWLALTGYGTPLNKLKAN